MMHTTITYESGRLGWAGIVALLLGAALLGGCVSHTVKSTAVIDLETAERQLPENLLLDVGVAVFDPGLEEKGNDDFLYPEVRNAESRYMAGLLAQTIRGSGAWGAVRVVPQQSQPMDLLVSTTILLSHGEALQLRVLAKDSTGTTWLKKTYRSNASRYSYGTTRARTDPFQSLYNAIANDLLAALRKRDAEQLANIRLVSELRFAQGFSPGAFADHLRASRRGRYKILRLPAANDPMLERVRRIRERDQLFIDTLQDYYASFNAQMQAPYQEWRKESYDEALAVQELRAEARRNFIAGAASVVGGILAAGSNNRSTRAAGSVAIAGGGYMVSRGLNKIDQAALHLEQLSELSLSLEAEIAPQVIELEDRTVTLTGTVQDQYAQWRQLLREIYEAEVGDLQPAQQGAAN